jgi:DNA-nicking Smr family endonuclease
MNFLSAYLHTEEEGKLSSNQKISGDEMTLFRKAMQGVRPLAESGRVILAQPEQHSFARPRIQAVTQQSCPLALDEQLIMKEGETWSFVRPGLQRYTLRKLRRGYWPVQDELDLHGCNRNEAYQILMAFLGNVVLQGYRCVRVIHGRGLSSKNRKPVLKKRVGGWLMQINDVLAFCQAQSSQGGSGALLVLLRNPNKLF